MMSRPRTAAVLLVAASLPAAAIAQIVPPPPPPAEKTPPYEPPAPPTAPTPIANPQANQPTPPPEPEQPLPSIVKRDDKGRVLLLDASPEEAAIRAFAVDDQTRANIEKGIAENNAELDKRVLDNIPLVISTVKARESIGTVDDLNKFFTLATSLKPIRQASLLDRLVRANAITARQRARADQVVKEYTEASTKSITEEAGDNVTAVIPLSARRSFLEASADAARSFDRLVAAAAPKADALLGKLTITDAQRSKITAALAAAKSTADNDPRRAQALRSICLDVLTPEQTTELLKSANPQ